MMTLRKIICCLTLAAFLGTSLIPPSLGFTQTVPVNLISLTPVFQPTLVKGIKIFPNNPLRFDFIVDPGDSGLNGDLLKAESTKLIKYFLASVTTPAKDMWVNLSPKDKNRIIPESFGQTLMGQGLLNQDYLLKQLTASLLFPEGEIGKKFWEELYSKAKKTFNATEIPLETLNRIWIVPEKAVVYAKGDTAYVVDSHLKVLLEEEYLGGQEKNVQSVPNSQSTQLIKEILLPAVEKEINEGKNFAELRQIYHAMILATWFKRNLKQSLLGQMYSGQNKIEGVAGSDRLAKNKIYDHYLELFKQGSYNYIKEEYDPDKQQVVARKYISGGMDGEKLEQIFHQDGAMSADAIRGNEQDILVTADLMAEHAESLKDSAQLVEEIIGVEAIQKAQVSLRDISSPTGARVISRMSRESIDRFKEKNIGLTEVELNKGELRLVSQDHWAIEETPLFKIDPYGVILNKIKELYKKLGPARTIRILDWGMGKGVGLTDLYKQIQILKQDPEFSGLQVKLYGLSKSEYDWEWKNKPQDITVIFDTAENLVADLVVDAKQLNLDTQIDLIFSFYGIINVIGDQDTPNVGAERHFEELKSILSPEGEIQVFGYAEPIRKFTPQLVSLGFDVEYDRTNPDKPWFRISHKVSSKSSNSTSSLGKEEESLTRTIDNSMLVDMQTELKRAFVKEGIRFRLQEFNTAGEIKLKIQQWFTQDPDRYLSDFLWNYSISIERGSVLTVIEDENGIIDGMLLSSKQNKTLSDARRIQIYNLDVLEIDEHMRGMGLGEILVSRAIERSLNDPQIPENDKGYVAAIPADLNPGKNISPIGNEREPVKFYERLGFFRLLPEDAEQEILEDDQEEPDLTLVLAPYKAKEMFQRVKDSMTDNSMIADVIKDNIKSSGVFDQPSVQELNNDRAMTADELNTKIDTFILDMNKTLDKVGDKTKNIRMLNLRTGQLRDRLRPLVAQILDYDESKVLIDADKIKELLEKIDQKILTPLRDANLLEAKLYPTAEHWLAYSLMSIDNFQRFKQRVKNLSLISAEASVLLLGAMGFHFRHDADPEDLVVMPDLLKTVLIELNNLMNQKNWAEAKKYYVAVISSMVFYVQPQQGIDQLEKYKSFIQELLEKTKTPAINPLAILARAQTLLGADFNAEQELFQYYRDVDKYVGALNNNGKWNTIFNLVTSLNGQLAQDKLKGNFYIQNLYSQKYEFIKKAFEALMDFIQPGRNGGKSEFADRAVTGDAQSKDLGGIDFNTDKMNLETKGEAVQFNLPESLKGVDLQSITGFTPVIIQMTPMTNLPLFLGIVEKDSSEQLSLRTGN